MHKWPKFHISKAYLYSSEVSRRIRINRINICKWLIFFHLYENTSTIRYILRLIDESYQLNQMTNIITSANETEVDTWSLGTDCADWECKLWSPASILRVIAFKSFPKQISLFLPSLTLWTSISFLG